MKYSTFSGLSVVAVQTEPEFAAGAPVVLFEGEYFGGWHSSVPRYDVTADGLHFLMVIQAENEGSSYRIDLVLNWFDELERLTPAH